MRFWLLSMLVVLAGCAGDPAPEADGEGGGEQTVSRGQFLNPEEIGPQQGLDWPAVSEQLGRAPADLHAFEFTARDADARARQALGVQLAYVDQRVAPRHKLVVYLHGAGNRERCGEGDGEHERMLAALGYHVFSPCYVTDYELAACGDRVDACRLEAIEGVDHSTVLAVPPADGLEQRIMAGLRYLQIAHPGGDWAQFLGSQRPRWRDIVISGRSHGAATAALIGQQRRVERVVMLAGPLDRGQAWLRDPARTPIERFFAFSHTADENFDGFVEAWQALGLPGAPATVDGAAPPYGGTHQLITSAPTDHAHSAVRAGGSTPRAGEAYVYLPAWRVLYGAWSPPAS